MSGQAATILTLDRGNSTLDCRLSGPGVDDRRRLDPDDPAAFDAFLRGRRPDRAAALTVVSGGLSRAARVLARLGVPLAEAGVDLPCPLEVDYADPRELGADRWVGALAAHRAFGAAITVDCGTAVTVNLVSADGCFLGGAIAPGARTMARALAEAAPALPRADLDAVVDPPARTARDAVEFGVGAGFAGLVEALVSRLAEACGLGGATRVATGGGAPLLARWAPGRFVLEPALVHDGLRILSCEHESSS